MPPPSAPWTAFLHPLLALAGLVLGWLALGAGLKARSARLARRPGAELPGAAQGRHLRLARPAVGLLVLSLPIGLSTATWVREMKPLHTAHGWLAAAAAVCFLGAGLLGTRLVKKTTGKRGLHAGLSVLGLFLGLVAALTGIELLP